MVNTDADLLMSKHVLSLIKNFVKNRESIRISQINF